MTMTKMRSKTVFAALSLLAGPTAAAVADERGGRKIPVEMLLYETLPAHVAEAGDPLEFEAAQFVEPQRLRAFVVRFELDAGERLIAAHGSIVDGAARQISSDRPRISAARILGRLGYTLAMREVPVELQAGVAPLAGLLLPGRREIPADTAGSSRTLVLRGETMHHSGTAATTLIMLESNALTRIEFTRVVTRSEDGKKRRASSASMLLRSAPRIAKDELLQLLAGRPVESLLRNTEPLNPVVSLPESLPPPGALPTPSVAERRKGEDFGPPRP